MKTSRSLALRCKQELQDIRGANKASSRRNFLRGSTAAVAGAMAASAAAAKEPDPLITEVQDWASGTGDGVDATPYGLPIEFEKDVIRIHRLGVKDVYIFTFLGHFQIFCMFYLFFCFL